MKQRAPLKRCRCRLEYIIKIDVESGMGVDWMYLAWDKVIWRAFVKVVMEFWVHKIQDNLMLN